VSTPFAEAVRNEAWVSRATAHAFGQRHWAKLHTFHRRQAIVESEFAIQEGVVGSEELAWRQVFVEDVAEEHLGLGAHGGVYIVPKEADEVGGDGHLADVIEVQPEADEVLHEALRF